MPTPAGCPSLSALARLVGRDRKTVLAWFTHRHWPADVPTVGPWSAQHVRAILRFADRLKESRNPAGTARARVAAEAAVDLRLKEARAQRIELQNKITRKKVHDTAVCQRRMLAAISAVVAGMAAVAEGLPRELAGADRSSWPAIIQQRFAELCNAFADGVGQQAPTPRSEAVATPT